MLSKATPLLLTVSPSDQCKVILGLAVSNNGVVLDNMSLSFLICKLMLLQLCIVVRDNYGMVLRCVVITAVCICTYMYCDLLNLC